MRKRGNGFYGFKRFKGEGGGFAALLDDGILVSQPSPRGEGAPKGRIGHSRHERERKMRLKQVIYGGSRASIFVNGNDRRQH